MMYCVTHSPRHVDEQMISKSYPERWYNTLFYISCHMIVIVLRDIMHVISYFNIIKKSQWYLNDNLKETLIIIKKYQYIWYYIKNMSAYLCYRPSSIWDFM